MQTEYERGHAAGYEAATVQEAAHGFELRDWFAGQALMGLASRPDLHMPGFEHASGMAYEYADAMMREREKQDDSA